MRYTKSSEEILEEAVRKRVRKIKNFYGHLFVYVFGLTVYIGKTYYGVPLNFIPISYINEVFMWIWTFVIAIEGILLFFREMVFGDNWEKKRIQKMINEDKVEHKKWE